MNLSKKKVAVWKFKFWIQILARLEKTNHTKNVVKILNLNSNFDPAQAYQKRLLWWWYAPVRWKSTFSQRTLRPLLVERASSKFKYCSLLANIELVCLHGSIVLMCSPWLTNHSNPIWNKWTITVAVKTRCFELTFRTKQKGYWPASQTLLDSR